VHTGGLTAPLLGTTSKRGIHDSTVGCGVTFADTMFNLQCACACVCVSDSEQACLDCQAGYFGSDSALYVSTCSGPCTLGYYCPAGSTNNGAVQCRAGTYCPTGSAIATPCPAGLFQPDAGTGECVLECQAGYYCPPGSAMPIPCPAKQYSAATRSAACTPCSSTCASCDPKGTGDCDTCALGYFIDSITSPAQCTKCGNNQYAVTTRETSCTACDPTCVALTPSGPTCDSTTAICSACATGEFPTFGGTACV
jgi:hypothetical protein